MEWIDELFTNLLAATFPAQLGRVYFGSREMAAIQIQTWRAYFEGMSAGEIALEDEMTTRAVSKRISKVRDYICEAIEEGSSAKRGTRIANLKVLKAYGLSTSQAMRALMM